MRPHKRDNYMADLDKIALDIARRQAAGDPTTTGIFLVDIYHDDWCAHNKGGLCNCKPDVVMREDTQEAKP